MRKNMMREHPVGAVAVRDLVREQVVRHLAHITFRRSQDRIHTIGDLRDRQLSSRLHRNAEECGDVLQGLAEDEAVAACDHRDGADAQAPQLLDPVRSLRDVDRFEPDRTDREKLLEFQTAGSSRLPEHLDGFGHLLPLFFRALKYDARRAADASRLGARFSRRVPDSGGRCPAR